MDPFNTPNTPDVAANESIPAALDVTLTIPMDQLLGAYTQRPGRYYSSDPDDYQEEPPVVLDAIGERVAQMLLARFESDARKAAKARIDALIQERMVAIVDEALNGEVQRTNEWGEKVGTPTTVRALAVKTANEWLNEPADRYNRDKGTRGQKYIAEAVDRALKEDLDGALKAARAEITQRLRDKAAEAIAATVASMGGVR